jgi:hypothetical protein
MAVAHRWTITEYGPPRDLVAEIASLPGFNRARARELIEDAGWRVAAALNSSTNPFTISASGVRAADVAGLVRLGPGMELEIAPKFLGTEHIGWREDFFYLATLSRHGHLLSADRLRALSSPSADLATLVARALVQMYWDNHRRPVRTYRRRVELEFAVEGELEPETIILPEPDGYRQTSIRFDRANQFNSAIAAASAKLLPLTRDRESRAALQRIIERLGPQPRLQGTRKGRLPSRYRQWITTYELALDILQGFGLTYDDGRAVAPGYVVDTWRLWENLLTIAISASSQHVVAAQRPFLLGSRQRVVPPTRATPLRVWPDLAVWKNAKEPPILVDAKYKGRLDYGQQRISEADAYEALAFCIAADAERIALFYPRLSTTENGALGTVRAFERLVAAQREIVGADVEVRGISKRGGMAKFVSQVLSGTSALLA